jgi:hypothetical protein
MAGYELNLPSITRNNVLDTQTLTQTTRNVGATPTTYTAMAMRDSVRRRRRDGGRELVGPGAWQALPGRRAVPRPGASSGGNNGRQRGNQQPGSAGRARWIGP